MYQDWYANISEPLRCRPALVRALRFLDRALVALVALAYLGALVWLATTGDARLSRAASVPAVSFAAVSALRALINAPRPYELYAIDPLIRKDTHGKSFPGRHVFSACIIACALTWIDARFGLPAFTACALLAATRIIGGVHFPRDIIAALALGIAIGAIGFVAIP